MPCESCIELRAKAAIRSFSAGLRRRNCSMPARVRCLQPSRPFNPEMLHSPRKSMPGPRFCDAGKRYCVRVLEQPVSQPLLNRRILVTRGASQAPKLSDGLRALGAVPVEVPVLEIAPPESYEPLDVALRDLPHYDWLIVTSSNT